MATEKFWSDPSAEPKRAYRWTVKLGDAAEFIAKKVSKPSFTVTETAHTYLNHKFYYPGRVEWNTVTMTLVDSVSPNGAQQVLAMIKDSGYMIPDNPDSALSTMSKQRSVQDGLREVYIHQLHPDGSVMETWVLNNAWIKDVKFGELDYESDDMVEIELELRYDFATLQ